LFCFGAKFPLFQEITPRHQETFPHFQQITPLHVEKFVLRQLITPGGEVGLVFLVASLEGKTPGPGEKQEPGVQKIKFERIFPLWFHP
jgi:hypothetical protein